MEGADRWRTARGGAVGGAAVRGESFVAGERSRSVGIDLEHTSLIRSTMTVLSRPRVLLVGAYERDNFGDLLFLLVTERYLGQRRRRRRRAVRRRHARRCSAGASPPTARCCRSSGSTRSGPSAARSGGWTSSGRTGCRRARGRGGATPPPPTRAARRSSAARRATRRSPRPTSPTRPPSRATPARRRCSTRSASPASAASSLRGARPCSTTLRRAGAIAVRDRGSSRLLTELGIEHALVPDAVHALGVLRPGREPVGEDAVVQISSARLRMLGHSRVGAALAASETLRRTAGAAAARRHGAPATTRPTTTSASCAPPAAHAAASTSRSSRSARPLALADRIRHARVVAGTSLHVRIVAAAYGVPRVSLAKPKPTRYARHWDPDMPYEVGLEHARRRARHGAHRGRPPGGAGARGAPRPPRPREPRTARANHRHILYLDQVDRESGI